jgi:hypothetical protein
MCDPHWTAYLTALATPVIAGFGISIAHRQATTAKAKLKLDLFYKRVPIYVATRTFINSILQSNKVTDEATAAFKFGIQEAKWLLNDDIATYLKQIELEANTYWAAQKEANIEQSSLSGNWLDAQLIVIDKKFTPFIKMTPDQSYWDLAKQFVYSFIKLT